MNITYSDLMTAFINRLAEQWRMWRMEREIIACNRGMEVCQSIIDNELVNKAAYQKQQMILIKELSDKGSKK